MTTVDNFVMARKPKKAAASAAKSSEQYRKAHKSVRIKIRLAECAETAAQYLEQDLTQYVNDALRERLTRDGHWPPKP